MSKIKIAIVDDHKLFREGLHALLSKHEDLDIIINANSGAELLKKLREGYQPEVLLLDLTMPEMSGFEVLEKLRKNYAKIRSIAISMHNDGSYIVQCVRSGAYGYLLKNADEDELLQAINDVYEGKKYFNQVISQMMIDLIAVEGTQPKKLSAKENEILKLIAAGQTTKIIASELFISTRTVETHRANMMKKMDVKNTAELIKKATALHLL